MCPLQLIATFAIAFWHQEFILILRSYGETNLAKPSSTYRFDRRLTMVTTTSLSPDLKFRVSELEKTFLPEDREIADAATARLDELVKRLKPILIYIDQDVVGVRGVIAAKEGERLLILSRDGEWYICSCGRLDKGPGHWRSFIFETIIEGIKKSFDEAMKKKDEHRAAVAKRKEILDGFGEVMKSAAAS